MLCLIPAVCIGTLDIFRKFCECRRVFRGCPLAVGAWSRFDSWPSTDHLQQKSCDGCRVLNDIVEKHILFDDILMPGYSCREKTDVANAPRVRRWNHKNHREYMSCDAAIVLDVSSRHPPRSILVEVDFWTDVTPMTAHEKTFGEVL